MLGVGGQIRAPKIILFVKFLDTISMFLYIPGVGPLSIPQSLKPYLSSVQFSNEPAVCPHRPSAAQLRTDMASTVPMFSQVITEPAHRATNSLGACRCSYNPPSS